VSILLHHINCHAMFIAPCLYGAASFVFY